MSNEMLQKTIDLVSSLEVKTETQQIAKYELIEYTERLHKENQELKEQLEVGKEQYNDLVEEKENLQEQLSIKTLQLEEIKLSKRDYTQENILVMKLTLKETQQKEFIEYLESEIKRLEENNIYEPLQRTALATFQHVLSKYKEIIGVKDE